MNWSIRAGITVKIRNPPHADAKRQLLPIASILYSLFPFKCECQCE